MNDQLSKIDHLAIIVENIEKSVELYEKGIKLKKICEERELGNY